MLNRKIDKEIDYHFSNSRRAVVLCNDNLHVRGNVEYLPIYMIMFIARPEEPKDLIDKVCLPE